MTHAPRRPVQGFSLLEAMVALVILASSGWALFSWVNASIVSLRRVEDANARSAATSNAVEYMQSVNPMLRPQGQMDMGSYRISWAATPLMSPLPGTDFQRGRSNYDLALYDTTVRAFQGDADKPWFEFRLRQVGFKEVRKSINPFIMR